MNKKLLIIVGIGVILIVIVLFFMDSIIALFTGGSDVQVTQNIQLSQQRRARQQQAQVQKAEEETETKESEQTEKEVTEEQTSESSESESEEVVEEKKEGENEVAPSEEEEEVKPEEKTKQEQEEKVEEQSSEEEEEMEVKPAASQAIAKKEEQKSIKAKKEEKNVKEVKSEESEESEESEDASSQEAVQKPVIQPKPQPERSRIMEDDYDYSNSQFNKLNKYFKTKQYSQLLSEVDELVKNNNADGKILYLAGLAAYNTGDKESAKRYFTLLRKNISTDNENNRHLYYWAKIYLEKLK
ncbi:MAG TPA: hypothetical protein PLD27_03875 [bacterium]|nr:hypothetical protein [bacterium]HPQ18602.1 hypothetical protein [bacterium]